jgi:transcriptional regulator with XRE-family HTH domain
MSQEPAEEGRAEEEARRLLSLINKLARMLGYSVRELERRGNLNHVTAVKYLRGEGEPRLDLVLKLVEGLGLDYGEFFELAYGASRGAPRTEAMRVIRAMTEGMPQDELFGSAGPARPERGTPPADLETFKRAVREVLAELHGQDEISKRGPA